MQLVERHIVKDRNYIDICSKTKDLYNQCLYYWKQSIFGKIQYKGLLNGIKVEIIQEAYTSKCSALDLEPIQKHEKYLGKRVKRGLFRTQKGLKINADVNGSLNIARIVAGDKIITDSVRSIVLMPKKFTLYCK